MPESGSEFAFVIVGADRLWAADCSVMPTRVSGNTNIPRDDDRGKSGRHDRGRRPTTTSREESMAGSGVKQVVAASMIGATIEW